MKSRRESVVEADYNEVMAIQAIDSLALVQCGVNVTNALQTVQAIFLAPTITALDDAGLNVDRLLTAAKLQSFEIDRWNAALPLPLANAFFEEIARTETGPRLDAAIAARYSLANLSPWSQAITSCPNLLTACQLVCKTNAGIFTNNRLSLSIDGATATFKDQFTTPKSLAQEWSSLFSVFMLLDAFRAACGSHWLPLELDIACTDITALVDAIDLSGVVVRAGQSENRMRFLTADLCQQFLINTNSSTVLEPLPQTSEGRLVEVLNSMQQDYRPTQDRLAEMFDMSPRTLQRKLGEDGTTFSEAMDHWRLKQSLLFLQDPQMQVVEIAARLHYSTSSHFSRSFRRWTGVTPGHYREAAARVTV